MTNINTFSPVTCYESCIITHPNFGDIHSFSTDFISDLYLWFAEESNLQKIRPCRSKQNHYFCYQVEQIAGIICVQLWLMTISVIRPLTQAVLIWCHVSEFSFLWCPASSLCMWGEKTVKDQTNTHTDMVTPSFIPEAGSSSEVSLAFTVKTPEQGPDAWLVQVNTTGVKAAQAESTFTRQQVLTESGPQGLAAF